VASACRYLLHRLDGAAPIAFPVPLAAALLAYRGIGPSLPRWLLTGNHRLVPGMTNRQEFQEL
jgi:hypothetical protein